MRSLALCALMLAAVGCNDDVQSTGATNSGGASMSAPLKVGDGVPATSAADVNASSARFGETVSPADYSGEVSAWYFGHAT